MSKKKLTGTVIRDKMDKTIVVEQERLVRHPVYKKYIKRSIRVKAHDEKNEAKSGDRVEIIECRPLSADKHWRLLRVIEKTAK